MTGGLWATPGAGSYARAVDGVALQTGRAAQLAGGLSMDSAREVGFRRLHLCDFFDEAAADPISSETAHGARIVFAFDNGQPGDAVIEHGGGCDERRILKSYKYCIRGQKVT